MNGTPRSARNRLGLGLLTAILLWTIVVPTGCPPRAAAATPGAGATTTAAGFITLLAASRFAAAGQLVAPSVRSTMTAAVLQHVWQALLKRFGPFQRQEGTSEQEAGGYGNVTVTCAFGYGDAGLIVTIDRTGKVAGLHIAQATVPYVAPS